MIGHLSNGWTKIEETIEMTVRKNALLSLLFLPLAVMLAASSANAGTLPITFTSSGASVSFTLSGGDMIVTLTNTSTADVMDPSQVLTGVFFKFSGGTLTSTGATAKLASGSTVISCGNGCTLPTAGNVGGEWAYAANLNQYGANDGLSSSGLGLFGDANLCGAANCAPFNLQGPVAVDGVQYGITSAGDNPATSNPGLAKNALIKNSVVFSLPVTGTPNVSTVTFQYGTSLSDAFVTGDCTSGCGVLITPEPSSLPLVVMGMGFLAVFTLKRKASGNR
jgi:hypothetical protein